MNFSEADCAKPLIVWQKHQGESTSRRKNPTWLLRLYGRYMQSPRSWPEGWAKWGQANKVNGHSCIGGMSKIVGGSRLLRYYVLVEL